ncbi:hypothetical protein KAK06_04330 [Ideonella sp. 4Y11]|uniref:Uncharacterized protein n=1 Tax=Ideonella aquatica TaxID=2824119 RepID=A0A940YDJ2_9BURK|nr:hypothetical protein [Ideonella aquatica]MBQ0958175.1 hypothetical protein [Ideonella aquatica]
MTHTKRLFAASTLVLASLSAVAATVSDNFNLPEIDATRWSAPESYRYVDNGRLYLGQWGFGNTASNSGVTVTQLGLSQLDTSPARAVKVTIAVEDIDRLDGCAANTTPSTARARVIGNYFSTRVGGPVAGDFTGDVLAQAWLRRSSNSTDAPGVLRVAGGVPQCTNLDCSTSNNLGSVDLGTANVGDKVTLQIEWDAANNQFLFIRDGGTPLAVPYTVTITGTPARPFNSLTARAEVANCMAGRAKAGIGAQFDNYGIVH